ncbi:hypothetical protein GCM10029978_059570 [Actinoallomurus acanthiterrae]
MPIPRPPASFVYEPTHTNRPVWGRSSRINGVILLVGGFHRSSQRTSRRPQAAPVRRTRVHGHDTRYGDADVGSETVEVLGNELGATLRDRRDERRLKDFGSDVSVGRRIRGLRRQRVARLAGGSVDHLVQLEQVRAKAASAQALAALAQALRLSETERLHLFFLAGQSPQDGTRRREAVPDSEDQPAPRCEQCAERAWLVEVAVEPGR